jgi:hypothetical protein
MSHFQLHISYRPSLSRCGFLVVINGYAEKLDSLSHSYKLSTPCAAMMVKGRHKLVISEPLLPNIQVR